MLTSLDSCNVLFSLPDANISFAAPCAPWQVEEQRTVAIASQRRRQLLSLKGSTTGASLPNNWGFQSTDHRPVEVLRRSSSQVDITANPSPFASPAATSHETSPPVKSTRNSHFVRSLYGVSRSLLQIGICNAFGKWDGCWVGTSGPCKNPSNGMCADRNSSGACDVETYDCAQIPGEGLVVQHNAPVSVPDNYSVHIGTLFVSNTISDESW